MLFIIYKSIFNFFIINKFLNSSQITSKDFNVWLKLPMPILSVHHLTYLTYLVSQLLLIEEKIKKS